MSKRYVQSSMNSSSQEPTQTQEALSVLLCGGLAGVATWVSIFPLGINFPHINVCELPLTVYT
jgi:solute carrier family 25 carnitine/acylcarnitine transporter 20/29